MSSGFMGAAAAWWWGFGAARAFQSVLVLAMVMSKVKWMVRRVSSGDGKGGGCVGEGALQQQRNLQERPGS